MQICKLNSGQLRDALELIWEVFNEYEAPDYEEMGVKTFQHFIEFHSMKEKMESGEMKFWGCYQNSYLVGVIAIRPKQHISLLFVRGRFHHLGIASRLVRIAIAAIRDSGPELPAVTVNSSPYAVGFYKAVGFEPLQEEQKKDGIRYTPMRRGLDL